VEHCGAYFANRLRYVERVAAFFERYLDLEPEVGG
jgi:hypothetical protein